MELTTQSMDLTTHLPEGLDPVIPAKKFPQFMYCFIVSIGSLIIGTILGWTSPSLKYLEIQNNTEVEIHTSFPEESSYLAAWTPLGALLGAIPAGFLADYFGRRKTIHLFSFPSIISWLLLVDAPYIEFIHISRFISGCVVGLHCGVIPMYISEIAETSIRGLLGTFFQLFMALGVLLIYVLGTLRSYRTLCYFGALITIIYSILIYYVPETPIQLLRHGREEDAIKSLQLIRGSEYNVYDELDLIKNELEEITKPKVKNPTFTVGNVKAVIFSVMLMIIQQFTGINAVIFYGEQILIRSSVPDAHLWMAFIGALTTVSTIASIFLIEKVGRRILLLISVCGIAFSSAAIGYYLTLLLQGLEISRTVRIVVPITCLSIFIMSYGLGLGPIPWLMTAELLPPEMKTIGTGIATSMNWIGAFLVTFYFKSLSTKCTTPKCESGLVEASPSSATTPPTPKCCGNRLGIVFFVFSTIAFISVAFLYVFLPETKGKTIIQIRAELNVKKSTQNE